MSCLSDEMLSATLDGESSSGTGLHLRRCSRCSDRLERFRSLDLAMRDLPLASEAPPSTLAATLRGMAAAEPGPDAVLEASAIRRFAARVEAFFQLRPNVPRPAFGSATISRLEALLLLRPNFLRPILGLATVGAAVAILVVAPVTGSPSLALADDAVSNHLNALAMGDGSGCDVESEDPRTLAAWLRENLNHDVEVPLMAGATLVGARRCSLLGEDTAAVVYRAGETTFSLYLPPKGSAAAAACDEEKGRCIEGRNGQTVCVIPDPGGSPWLMVGGLPSLELCSVAVSG